LTARQKVNAIAALVTVITLDQALRREWLPAMTTIAIAVAAALAFQGVAWCVTKYPPNRNEPQINADERE
jgi:hypothetical protein